MAKTEGRILVTGANGSVGSHLVRALAESGWDVVAGVRRKADASFPNVQIVEYGDVATSDASFPPLDGITQIVHLAGSAKAPPSAGPDYLQTVNCKATLKLAEQAEKSGVEHFVFVSSAAVYERPERRSGTTVKTIAPDSDYGRSKLHAENQLADKIKEMAVTIVRPSLVIGTDVGGNTARIVSAIRRGAPLPLGSADNNRRDFVSIGVLVEYLEKCLSDRSLWRANVTVTDHEPISTRQLIVNLGHELGKKPWLVPISEPLLRKAIALVSAKLASQLLDDYVIDPSLLPSDGGWIRSSLENISRRHL